MKIEPALFLAESTFFVGTTLAAIATEMHHSRLNPLLQHLPNKT